MPQTQRQAATPRSMEDRSPRTPAHSFSRRPADQSRSNPYRRARTTCRPASLRTRNPKKSLADAPWSREQQREIVMKLAGSYPIRLVCRLLGLPRSSVYYRARPPLDEAVLKTALLDVAAEWPTYGYRRLTA